MTLLLLICIVVGFIYRDNILSFFQYFMWKNQIENVHNYDENKVKFILEKIANNDFQFSGENLPYGRAKWFINCDEKICKELKNDDLDLLGFSPVRSKIEMEFREYGIALSTEGLIHSCQIQDKNNKKKFSAVSTAIPYAGLWRIRFDNNKKVLKFFYPRGKIIKIDISANEKIGRKLENDFELLFQTGYTNDLTNGYVDKKIKEKFDYSNIELNDLSSIGVNAGALGYVNADLGGHFHSETLNGIVNNPQGHGLAAEYANDVADRLRKPFQKVQRVGQDNRKNGADRIVGNTKIQTKYYVNSNKSLNAAFESKANGGMYKYVNENGTPMQLEVPHEQYDEVIKLMKEKIKQGKVPGVTDPNDAYKIVRQGRVTYEEAKLIAQGGNIVSLKYDALDGVVQTLPVAGISFIIVFAQAKWSGANTKDAAITAAKAGVRTLVIGTTVYAGSQQFAKIFTKRIAEATSKKIAAETVARGAGMAISFGIVMGPNLFDSLSGRISKEQLLKNTMIAGGGALAGVGATAGAGAALGSFVPGAGTVVGAVVGATAGIVGGMVGSVGTKKILDHFIEDDRIEMFAQLKEEFIDVTMSMSISPSEFEKIQTMVFNKSLESKLKNMFKHRADGSRLYARENIVEAAILVVIKERPIIYDEDVINGVVQLSY